MDTLELVELAVPVKVPCAVRPAFFNDVEPLLSQTIACFMIIGELKTQCFVLRFVPAADDIETGPAMPDLVQGSQLFCSDYGVVEAGMCRRKDRDFLVEASRPAAQVRVSSTLCWKLVAPP